MKKTSLIYIVGSDFQWEEQAMLNEIGKKGIEGRFISIRDYDLQLKEKTRFMKNGQNFFESLAGNERFILRRSRGAFVRLVVLAELLQKRGFVFTDTFRAIGTNLNKEIFMPTIESNIFPHPETYFVEYNNHFQEKSLDFPLISKPVLGRHGEGIYIHENQESLEKAIEEAKETLIVQKCLDIDYEFRIFVLGNKALGAIQKIPEKGKRIANYAAGAQFRKIDLPQKFHDEAVRLCQIQEIEIGGVDIAKSIDGHYFLLEINRCPEFKASTEALGINIAEKIIDFILHKNA